MRPARTKSLPPRPEKADAPRAFPSAHPTALLHVCSSFIGLPGWGQKRGGGERLAGSVGVIPGVLHDDLERQPRLLRGGDDLGGRQHEAIAPHVPELEGVGVLDALVVGPVNGAAAGSVWGRRETGGQRSVTRTFLWAARIGPGPSPEPPQSRLESAAAQCLLLIKQPAFLPRAPEGLSPQRGRPAMVLLSPWDERKFLRLQKRQ